MKKTLGQVFFEHHMSLRCVQVPWEDLSSLSKNGWQIIAAKLAADFDSIRGTTNCNDEQTDDSSGVPVNVDTLD